MTKRQFDYEVQPLSTFRAKVDYYFEQVKKTKKPLIISQNDGSSAILMDFGEYQRMADKIEIPEDIKLAESQINEGMAILHEEAKKKFNEGI